MMYIAAFAGGIVVGVLGAIAFVYFGVLDVLAAVL